ncbi:tRNA 2-selenouridine synthase [Salinihabitans flavidus]|uniref:tRNA 2-selenouridine synthase n=1 Tax=Salinihabitans flavidus TaxID=569882 RepID=A0A1H8MJ30_9RHOB|nr:tRNA 2-selenouridine(34) synthase MnmH [Salinihabitans flavidus]SEO17284.1 tRNA 2-selenouridine synthase [Salinihabitans flavidus]
MAERLTSLQDLAQLPHDDIIDVRSPSEYAEDHIPGAISLPVLSDEERAHVGTIYVQQDRFLARKVGAALVARNAAAHLEGPLADRTGGWRPLVYCWRGGQRSGSFASILEQVGWRVGLIEGGYKSYRRLVVGAMHDTPLAHRVVVIDGGTGTAKTDVLHHLADRGAQVLDLEGLAAHRGSVFGARPGGQPSQKRFEGMIAMRLTGMDTSRPVYVEAESNRIGGVFVPPALWKAMTRAPRVLIEASVEARAAYLVRAYADLLEDGSAFGAALAQLAPHHGKAQIARWQEMLAAGELRALAQDLMERHYDPRYAKSSARLGAPLARVAMTDLDAAALGRAADRILALDLPRRAPVSGT